MLTHLQSTVLNRISHISYYGCCYCFNKGKRFVRRHYYPVHPHDMKTLESYKLDLSSLARNPGLKSSRGPSALSNFLPNLLLSATINYMHQIVLGVGRIVPEQIQKEIGNSALMEIENIVRIREIIFWAFIESVIIFLFFGFFNHFSFLFCFLGAFWDPKVPSKTILLQNVQS